MNKEQKTAAFEEVASEIQTTEPIFAVDDRGISLALARRAGGRDRLRDDDARGRARVDGQGAGNSAPASPEEGACRGGGARAAAERGARRPGRGGGSRRAGGRGRRRGSSRAAGRER